MYFYIYTFGGDELINEIEISSLNLNDIKILLAILDKDNPTIGRSEIKGVTIKKLIEKTNFSHVKIRNTIKMFSELGLIKDGLRAGNSRTYYLTDDGLEFLKRSKES